MSGKVLDKSLGVLVVAAVLISVGFLYIKYIIQHDYEILYLTEEEREEFWQSMAEEEGYIYESDQLLDETGTETGEEAAQVTEENNIPSESEDGNTAETGEESPLPTEETTTP